MPSRVRVLPSYDVAHLGDGRIVDSPKAVSEALDRTSNRQ